jgi:hypothetical protein
MMTLTTAVILGALYLSYRWGHLAAGSCIAGVLAGLVFANSPIGAPIATAVRTSADSVGTSIRAGINEAIK